MPSVFQTLSSRVRRLDELTHVAAARTVARVSHPAMDHQPVLLFNVSTRPSEIGIARR